MVKIKKEKKNEIHGLGITKKQYAKRLVANSLVEFKKMKKNPEAYQDYLGLAQMWFKAYLLIELGTGYDTKQYKRLLKRGRKGLGYSYP